MQFRTTEDDEWDAAIQRGSLVRSSWTVCVQATRPNRSSTERNSKAYTLYAYCKRLGLEYGSMFSRSPTGGHEKDGAAWLDVNLQATTDSETYGAHPAILDACFHGMIAADADFDHTLGGLYLPAEIKRLRFLRPLGNQVRCHVSIKSKTQQRMLADIDIFDLDGHLAVSIEWVRKPTRSWWWENQSRRFLIWFTNTIGIKQDFVAELPSPRHRRPTLAWCFQDNSGCGTQLVSQLRKTRCPSCANLRWY